jgi:hypothetical protein
MDTNSVAPPPRRTASALRSSVSVWLFTLVNTYWNLLPSGLFHTFPGGSLYARTCHAEHGPTCCGSGVGWISVNAVSQLAGSVLSGGTLQRSLNLATPGLKTERIRLQSIPISLSSSPLPCLKGATRSLAAAVAIVDSELIRCRRISAGIELRGP